MALNWNWNEKCGEVILNQTVAGEDKEFSVSLYQGNAYLILIYEYTDDDGKDCYDLYGFFNDKDHMRRCFGLDKKFGGRNLYTDWKKVRINKAKYRHTKELVTAIAEAFDDISIELYAEE